MAFRRKFGALIAQTNQNKYLTVFQKQLFHPLVRQQRYFCSATDTTQDENEQVNKDSLHSEHILVTNDQNNLNNLHLEHILENESFSSSNGEVISSSNTEVISSSNGEVISDQVALASSIPRKTKSLGYFNKSVIATLLEEHAEKSDGENSALERRDYGFKDFDASKLLRLKPALPKESSNLAAYVNESETLQKLIQLEVDLSRLEEKSIDAANHLVKARFEDDIQPVIEYLTQRVGVAIEDVKDVVARYPDVFLDFSVDYEKVVEYLEMRRFSREEISGIVTRAPHILSFDVKDIDAALGLLKQHFHMTAADVRQVVVKCPKLAVWDKLLVRDAVMSLRDFCGFSDEQQREIVKKAPAVYTKDRELVVERFDYLHNTIGFTHDDISIWPQILETHTLRIRQRHEFLTSIGRAQYDPKKENFVSLQRLCTGSDAEFCQNVAKSDLSRLRDFLRTR